MQITISALAAQLGELEPPGDDEPDREHFRRQVVVFAAARLLPVNTPQDAVLAICGIAARLTGVLDNEVTDAERTVAMEDAVRIAARIAVWLRDTHGVRPLSGMWPAADQLFDEQQEAAP